MEGGKQEEKNNSHDPSWSRTKPHVLQDILKPLKSHSELWISRVRQHLVLYLSSMSKGLISHGDGSGECWVTSRHSAYHCYWVNFHHLSLSLKGSEQSSILVLVCLSCYNIISETKKLKLTEYYPCYLWRLRRPRSKCLVRTHLMVHRQQLCVVFIRAKHF